MSKYLKPQMFIVLFLLTSSLIFISQYLHLFAFTSEELGKYFPYRWILTGHIIAGATALLTGPVQFIRPLRNRYWALHRILGKWYMICILLSALCALYLTFTTTDQVGRMYTVSLWFLLLVWVIATAMAWHTIRKRKVKEHEEWMVRSYICTFAFIVQNYILKIPPVMALAPFAEVSPNIFWFSWSVPLYGYQVYLSLRK